MGAVGWGLGSQANLHSTWWVALSLTVVSVLPSTTHSNFSSTEGEVGRVHIRRTYRMGQTLLLESICWLNVAP